MSRDVSGDAAGVALFARGPLAELARERRWDEALHRLHQLRVDRPNDEDVARAMQVARERVLQGGLERLGSLDAIPHVTGSQLALPAPPDARYVLSLVRGIASIDELLDVSTLGRHRTVRALGELLGSGHIELAPPSEASHEPSVRAGVRRAVIADASYAQAALTRTMLRVALGEHVTLRSVMSSGDLAFEVRRAVPDFVVVEFALPGSDGLTALRAVRHAAGAMVPAIVLVQRIERDYVAARAASDRTVVLARPVETAALVEALRSLGFVKETV